MGIHPNYFAGLSGLQLPVPKYLFPPPYQDASRLGYYASFFNSIEINRSFYKLPISKTIAKWTTEVPADFKFTFKLWKEITHVKGLHFERTNVETFLKVMAAAGNKKGCLLIQFPPSLDVVATSELERLLSTLKEVDQLPYFHLAVEFRHKSWYADNTYQLLDQYNTCMVTHDIPMSATPMVELESDIIYVRFHGPTGNYRGSYPEEILSEYAGYISEWTEEDKQVFVYFNNTMGDAFKNLQQLNALLRTDPG